MTMCNFSTYSDAIPLKKVDNQSVTFAMIKFFTSVCIPQEIHTAQGSVFMSCLMKQ